MKSGYCFLLPVTNLNIPNEKKIVTQKICLEQEIKHVSKDGNFFFFFLSLTLLKFELTGLLLLKPREFKLPVLPRERTNQASLKVTDLLLQAVLEVFKV